MDMQLVTINSDQLAGGREFLRVVPGGNGLVDQARDGQRASSVRSPKAIRLIQRTTRVLRHFSFRWVKSSLDVMMCDASLTFVAAD
jgi:hypothetical protein